MSIDSKSSYYDAGGIETIDIIKAKLTPEQYQGYLLGNIIKYSCRANFKNETMERDIEKVGVYTDQLKTLVKELAKPSREAQTEQPNLKKLEVKGAGSCGYREITDVIQKIDGIINLTTVTSIAKFNLIYDAMQNFYLETKDANT